MLLEAAIAWGYPTLEAWQNESTYNKGIVLGHYLWMRRREGFEADRQKEHYKSKQPGNKGRGADHAAFRYGSDILRHRLEAQRAAQEKPA